MSTIAKPMLSPVSSTSSNDAIAPRRKGRVSAEHTLNRVRENQRRHRARRRDHISALEEKLAETEKQLAHARAEIAELKAAREAGVWESSKPEGNDDIPMSMEEKTGMDEMVVEPVPAETELILSPAPLPPTTKSIDDEEQTPVSASFLDSDLQLNMDLIALLSPPSSASLTVPTQALSNQLALPSPPLPLSTALALPPLSSLPTGPPPCCTSTPLLTPSSLDLSSSPTSLSSLSSLSSQSSSQSSPSTPTPALLNPNPECTTCATRPAPSPTESTTLCSQAYVLIASQNFRGVDAETVRVWLYQGFRRARAKGEGCRVENGALMGLLDFISGV